MLLLEKKVLADEEGKKVIQGKQTLKEIIFILIYFR